MTIRYEECCQNSQKLCHNIGNTSIGAECNSNKTQSWIVGSWCALPRDLWVQPAISLARLRRRPLATQRRGKTVNGPNATHHYLGEVLRSSVLLIIRAQDCQVRHFHLDKE